MQAKGCAESTVRHCRGTQNRTSRIRACARKHTQWRCTRARARAHAHTDQGGANGACDDLESDVGEEEEEYCSGRLADDALEDVRGEGEVLEEGQVDYVGSEVAEEPDAEGEVDCHADTHHVGAEDSELLVILCGLLAGAEQHRLVAPAVRAGVKGLGGLASAGDGGVLGVDGVAWTQNKSKEARKEWVIEHQQAGPLQWGCECACVCPQMRGCVR
jgi:hypothetical protein